MLKNARKLVKLKLTLINLIEKYHPFNLRSFKAIFSITMTILLGTVLILGWLSSNKVRVTVTDDFNQQQLFLARHAARQIENSLESIKRELLLLSLSPSIQYKESAFMGDRMKIAFSSIKHESALEIRFTDTEKKTFIVSDKTKFTISKADSSDIECLNLAKNENVKGTLFITKVTTDPYNHNGGKPIMKMAIPVWQVSVDESHPVALNKFSGVMVFVIDISSLIESIVKELRSGKTGYAWVIDEDGTFLYHEEKSFIGKNAFEARKGKKPTISFARINEIQKEKMLKGQEGKSWYISGWHRGIEGEIKKLIAYTPIKIDEKNPERTWSVAVVAPVSEVEGAIHSIHLQQSILQAIIISVILFGGLFVNFMILSWSNILEQEVARKTNELKKSEQRYRSLIENAEDLIYTVDYDGNFLSINKYGANFFNKSSSEIIGKNISEIFTWPSSEVLTVMIQTVFNTKESKQLIHMVIIGENEYWFSTNLRRLWDEAGNIYAVLGISRDITDRKKLEEHSYYTEKLASMGTLAAGVAHEINNPLGIILGFTELLLEKFPAGSEEYKMLKTIEKQGLNAKRVVENLLNFARHKEHKEELVDINKSIKTVLSVMGNTILLNKIEVKENLQEVLPPVLADEGELQQVFFNIINNAIYAMSQKGGGVLTINTSNINSDTIDIRISDTGDGIKKEHRKRIFDPLFTTKEVGKGTGLGLSISYGIVIKHGGSITFQTKTRDESLETGTTFIINLPAAKVAYKEI